MDNVCFPPSGQPGRVGPEERRLNNSISTQYSEGIKEILAVILCIRFMLQMHYTEHYCVLDFRKEWFLPIALSSSQNNGTEMLRSSRVIMSYVSPTRKNFELTTARLASHSHLHPSAKRCADGCDGGPSCLELEATSTTHVSLSLIRIIVLLLIDRSIDIDSAAKACFV